MSSLAVQLGEPDAAGAAALPIRTVDLGRTINDRPILRGVNLSIAGGEYLAILGPNGAGKSTLLHVLATLTRATVGEYHLFGTLLSRSGRNAAPLRSRIGMIGHQPMLYRHLSALENLRLFGRLYGLPDVESRARELLLRVQLADRADDPVATFSRGMTQRVAIARALMHDPDLLLADEPFSGLDVPSTRTLEALLAQLHQAGKTVVLVNHDIGQSIRLARRVVVLRRGTVVANEPTAAVSESRLLHEVTGS